MKKSKKDCHKIDFIESWNSIEEFYSSFIESSSSSGKDALRLIKQMQDLGLDEKNKSWTGIDDFHLIKE
ncbi:hypothetical protein [uncultured Dokdonia sp.]|uniref:hypothetical protein n=1 Tax=uncultured Dokdonia sp. TaxID=575653 RepID=UPI002628D0D8|nr:hypothetical protein [uncultured Dokdonia sp.]